MAKKGIGKSLGAKQRTALLATLAARFERNMPRHKGMQWAKVQKKLEANPDALWSLSEMERTGGEPDVVALDRKPSAHFFVDCSSWSPVGRRSVCYDGPARRARKKHPPETSALEMAHEMGAELLNEEAYRRLQALGAFGSKTSSWLETPADIRKLGGALFGDYRFGTVFVYHNGADSYYAARGFRCSLKI